MLLLLLLFLDTMARRMQEEAPRIQVSDSTRAEFAKEAFNKLQQKLDKKQAQCVKGAHPVMACALRRARAHTLLAPIPIIHLAHVFVYI